MQKMRENNKNAKKSITLVVDKITKQIKDPVEKLMFALYCSALKDLTKDVCQACDKQCETACDIKIAEDTQKAELVKFINFISLKEVNMPQLKSKRNLTDKDLQNIDLKRQKKRYDNTKENESPLCVVLPADLRKKLNKLAEERGGYGQLKAIIVEALQDYFKKVRKQ